MSLPTPLGKYGYTKEQITCICFSRGIEEKDFWKEFGVNTCAVVDGKLNYYPCDVEKALYALGHKDGKFHD